MKTKTIKLYTYKELSKEAKANALQDWITTNDYTFRENGIMENA